MEGIRLRSHYFIAALAGINQELYEAASIDRASRLQKIWNITLPGIKVTIVVPCDYAKYCQCAECRL